MYKNNYGNCITNDTGNIKSSKKKECYRCIEVFQENSKIQNDFIMRIAQSSPCKSTFDIIKAADGIFNLLGNHQENASTEAYYNALKTVMINLNMEELFVHSDFELHECRPNTILTHREEFIFKIVVEFMNMKSKKIGNRIAEENQGTYIRHNNKKRVHERGQ